MNWLQRPENGVWVHGALETIIALLTFAVNFAMTGNPFHLAGDSLVWLVLASGLMQIIATKWRNAGQQVTTAGNVHAQTELGYVSRDAPVILPPPK